MLTVFMVEDASPGSLGVKNLPPATRMRNSRLAPRLFLVAGFVCRRVTFWLRWSRAVVPRELRGSNSFEIDIHVSDAQTRDKEVVEKLLLA